MRDLADDHFRQMLLTEAIYRAALQPSEWQGVVSALGRVFDGVRFLFVGTDISQASSVPQVHLGYSAEAASSYVGYYQHVNPWWPAWRALSQGQVAHSLSAMPERTLLATEFYNDWLRPQEDLRFGVGTVLLRDRTRAYLLAGNYRGRDAPWADRAVAHLLHQLNPLMRHALEVNRMLLGVRLQALAAPHHPQASQAALMLLSRDCRVLYMNAAAHSLVGQGDGLVVSQGRPTFHASRINDAIASVCAGLGVRSLALVAPSLRPGGKSLQIRMVPLSESLRADIEMNPLDHLSGPLTLLVLSRQESAPSPQAVLRQALKLTAAEAEVAVALASGCTTREIAGMRQVTMETIRYQIKSMLHKTQSKRQADLVGRVAILLNSPNLR